MNLFQSFHHWSRLRIRLNPKLALLQYRLLLLLEKRVHRGLHLQQSNLLQTLLEFFSLAKFQPDLQFLSVLDLPQALPGLALWWVELQVPNLLYPQATQHNVVHSSKIVTFQVSEHFTHFSKSSQHLSTSLS